MQSALPTPTAGFAAKLLGYQADVEKRLQALGGNLEMPELQAGLETQLLIVEVGLAMPYLQFLGLEPTHLPC